MRVRDLLPLVAGIVLVSAISIASSVLISRHRSDARLRLTIPRLCAEVCQQRQFIAGAIDAYRQALNFYPPDHVLQENPLVVDAYTNQLLYELVGTVHDSTNRYFMPAGFSPISAQMVKSYFNADSIANSVERPEQIRHFLDSSNIIATLAVHQKPDVALLAFFPSWEGIEPELMSQIELGSWRYNHSSPTHNPGGYDLWIEIHTDQTNIVIGNW